MKNFEKKKFTTFFILDCGCCEGKWNFFGFGFSVTLYISSHFVKELTCENLRSKRKWVYSSNLLLNRKLKRLLSVDFTLKKVYGIHILKAAFDYSFGNFHSTI
jgi:hypothetical protein